MNLQTHQFTEQLFDRFFLLFCSSKIRIVWMHQNVKFHIKQKKTRAGLRFKKTSPQFYSPVDCEFNFFWVKSFRRELAADALCPMCKFGSSAHQYCFVFRVSHFIQLGPKTKCFVLCDVVGVCCECVNMNFSRCIRMCAVRCGLAFTNHRGMCARRCWNRACARPWSACVWTRRECVTVTV